MDNAKMVKFNFVHVFIMIVKTDWKCKVLFSEFEYNSRNACNAISLYEYYSICFCRLFWNVKNVNKNFYL